MLSYRDRNDIFYSEYNVEIWALCLSERKCVISKLYSHLVCMTAIEILQEKKIYM